MLILYIIEINEKVEIKKEVGITIKIKEISS